MTASLWDALRDSEPCTRLPHPHRQALESPWCWPHDELLAQQASHATGLGAPPPPTPGEVALLSVSGTATPLDALWRLMPQRGTGTTWSFVNTAETSLALALRLALRDLEVVADLSVLDTPADWCARFVLCEPPSAAGGLSSVLDGASYGLAFCLAEASRLLDVPVPPTVLATGEVDASGAVLRVDPGGLTRKVEFVARYALGVTHLLVPAEQRTFAEAARDGIGRRFEVCGVNNLADAFAQAFPKLEDRLDERWSDGDRAERAAEQIYRRAIDGHSTILRWNAVASAAQRLNKHLERAGRLRSAKRAAFAADIAHRHTGAGVLLAWPRDDDPLLDGLRRPETYELFAHCVQSAADHDDENAAAYASQALRRVRAQSERSEEDVKLLGAVGRALSSRHAFQEALPLLVECVTDWVAMRRAHLASHALCEALRVAGVLGRQDTVRTLSQGPALDLERDPRTSDISRSYLTLALGRAYIQADLPAEGLSRLRSHGDRFWQLAERAVRASRLRWLAIGCVREGKAAEAATLRDALDQLSRTLPSAATAARLARLDALLEVEASESDLHEALAALDVCTCNDHQQCNCTRREVRRFRARLEPTASARTVASQVVQHWRY